MKRIYTLIIAMLITTTFAQAGPYEIGSNFLGLGIGFGGSYGLGSVDSQTPGISLQYDHGIWPAGDVGVISLGGYLGFKSFKNSYSSYYYDDNLNLVPYKVSQKWSYTIVGVRGAFHWTGLKSDNWDLYGGVMISNSFASYSYDSPYNNYHDAADANGFVSITGFVGAKYYFSPKFVGFGEAGFGISFLTIGIGLAF